MIRIAGSAFPPLWVALLRCALGAGLLWAVLKLGGHQLPPRHLFPWLAAVALFNNALPFTFFAWGERTVPSNIAAVINATTPIWTLLLTMALHRTRVALFTIGGVILGFAGVLLVVVSHSADPAADHLAGGLLRGTIVISLAALGYAIATVMAKAKLRGLDPIGLATTQLSLAGLMILPFAMGGTHPLQPWLGPDCGHRRPRICRQRVRLFVVLPVAFAGFCHPCHGSDLFASPMGVVLGFVCPRIDWHAHLPRCGDYDWGSPVAESDAAHGASAAGAESTGGSVILLPCEFSRNRGAL